LHCGHGNQTAGSPATQLDGLIPPAGWPTTSSGDGGDRRENSKLHGIVRRGLESAIRNVGCGQSPPIAIHIVIGAQKFMRKSGGRFVFVQSARGLAHSKTLRVLQESSCRAQRLGLRPRCIGAAFPRGISAVPRLAGTAIIERFVVRPGIK
jgi:hypothetical protein